MFAIRDFNFLGGGGNYPRRDLIEIRAEFPHCESEVVTRSFIASLMTEAHGIDQ